MKLYLSYSQFPEIADLPPGQRKTAYVRYIYPLLLRWPVRLVKFAFTLLCFSAMAVFELYTSAGKTIAWLIGYLVADYLFDLATIALSRSRLRTAIHASEP
jgi:hypothetical protein